ncbi:hypothetical protein SETIT_6G089200v2 [Setaria italica]|uniref:Uncharacterized protein n=1 Tax=Setaria italica TaxID=4555 RepID=K3YJP8_SETIT|nr:hypothetical protein SETIT_6G089200v2 [Setaria italica]
MSRKACCCRPLASPAKQEPRRPPTPSHPPPSGISPLASFASTLLQEPSGGDRWRSSSPEQPAVDASGRAPAPPPPPPRQRHGRLRPHRRRLQGRGFLLREGSRGVPAAFAAGEAARGGAGEARERRGRQRPGGHRGKLPGRGGGGAAGVRDGHAAGAAAAAAPAPAAAAALPARARRHLRRPGPARARPLRRQGRRQHRYALLLLL